MNTANGSFKLRKSIVGAGHLIVVFAILVAALPKVPLEAASAHSELSMTLDDAIAAQASEPKVTQIVSGGMHTCALTPQGGVVCWGMNAAGELGNSTTTDSAVPVPVSGLSSGVMGLSLGGFRTCALTTHGQVYCWGSYVTGTTSSSTPVEVNGLGSQVVQLAVGASHACALTMAGSVLCWGFNGYGSLGNGTYTDSYSPVTAIASGAVQVVSNGNYSSCAVMASGGVECWGQGDRGQLGDGSYGSSHNSAVPVSVLKTGGSPLMGATHVVLGIVFACAQVSEAVYCWGVNRFGQLGIGTTDMNSHPYASPVLTAFGGPSLSGVDQLMAGDEHACVHLTDGSMQCWGHNIFGQLGNGSISYPAESVSTVPVTVLNSSGGAPLSGVTQMTGGSQHTCAFTSWEDTSPFQCWGINAHGQLGNGSISDGIPLPTPVSDIRLYSSVVEGTYIVAGGEHTCSITAGGGVSCWGNNAYGQLGNGTTSDSLDPVNVAGLGSDVKNLALGQDHTCAILSSGQLECWGRNQHGQLGNGTTDDSLVPTYVALFDVSVIQVAVGDDHTCALTEAGSVLCWGANAYGQLGDGSTGEETSPVTVTVSGVGGIALGGSTSCAVLTVGGVQCWGLGDVGQLGDGNSGTGYYQSTPTDTLVAVGSPLNGASQITMGTNFACTLKDDNVYCWGKNLSGQLGNGAASAFETFAGPVLSAVGGSPLQGVNQITAGSAHACAHQYTDRLKCWGDNSNGQLGDGSSDLYSAVPHPVLDPAQLTQVFDLIKLGSEDISYLEDAAQVSAEGNHTCAFFGWGSLNPYRCWGGNTHGQLGDGTTQDSDYPKGIKDFLTFGSPPVHRTVAGLSHSCALTAAGGVRCWGSNGYGQLGDGSGNESLTPVQVSGLKSGVVSLAAGENYTCALTSTGGVLCWGVNTAGQLGDSSNLTRTTPVQVSGLTSGITAITARGSHTCALTAAGGAKCWGQNDRGQLGNGTTTDSNIPVNVNGLAGGLVRLEAGGLHTCALTSTGGVKCWGDNDYGELGNGTMTDSPVPVDVTGLAGGITTLAAGLAHACAMTSSGGVKCWGNNSWGELGDGTHTKRLTPVDVNGLSTGVTHIDAGWNFTCALTSAGGIKCWGANLAGQLGDGSTTIRTEPVDVVGLPGGVTSIGLGLTFACAILSGPDPLRCWGNNWAGQFGDGTKTSSPTPVISKWLTSEGLIEYQKPEVLLLPDAISAIVVPAQPIPLHIVVHVTIVSPPSPPPGMAVLNVASLAYDDKISVHPFFLYDIPQLSGVDTLSQSLEGFDEGTLNLYYYKDGEWIPVLPCTGCTLDTTNHRLIANLDSEGIYAVMENTTTNVFLPIIEK